MILKSKKRVGLVLVLVSLVISSFNILFTGAVIGVGDFSLSLIAVVFFIAGVVLIFVGTTLESLVVDEGTVSLSEVVKTIDGIADGEEVSVVLDTSFLGSYSERGVCNLMGDLKRYYGGAIVSDSVLGELRGVVSNLRDSVLKQCVMPIEGYEKYRGEARKYLEKSRKAFYYDEVIPIILGEKDAPMSRHEAAPYVMAVKKLMSYVKNSGKELNKKNLINVANRHWKVSDVDVDVLASAIAEVRSGKKVIVAERDVDFEDAVREFRDANSEIRDMIYYINSYGVAA